MKTMTLGWMVALGLVGTAFASCAQPKTECQVALASTGYNYAVKYKVKSTPTAACAAQVMAGEQIGMEFYHPLTSDGLTYDSTKVTAAVQPDNLGSAIETYKSVGGEDPCYSQHACTKTAECDPDGTAGLQCLTGYCVDATCSAVNHPWGLGAFTSALPDANDYCALPTLTGSDTELPEVDDPVGGLVIPCAADTDCPPATSAMAPTCNLTTMTCSVGCTTDADCQLVTTDPDHPTDPASGAVCDATTSLCVPGCRGGMNATNTCVDPFGCTSGDDTVGQCLLPKTSVKYEWSNLKFYTTAAAPGTQFSGDVKITQDGCTIEYAAVGVWPGIPCAADLDCNACANPDAGTTIGSGLSPDFPIKCDTTLGLCTLRDAKDLTKDAESIPQILATSVDCGAVN